jgi:hypothetical protein
MLVRKAGGRHHHRRFLRGVPAVGMVGRFFHFDSCGSPQRNASTRSPAMASLRRSRRDVRIINALLVLVVPPR